MYSTYTGEACQPIGWYNVLCIVSKNEQVKSVCDQICAMSGKIHACSNPVQCVKIES